MYLNASKFNLLFKSKILNEFINEKFYTFQLST